ncbi:hypothetical protein Memar_1592 [Methanoculleus marisnigri JR1]|uniref:Uncharacterized protein n=1 Tax=Methanoculleus marisnigri (strain ATCC 35101 / DSM 1498 / JR1) TaxID=368407 RepID=A3CVX1_METMJ|nr:hypothetical protein Memar_1592 [Methanoculleus marisnigri JR1]
MHKEKQGWQTSGWQQWSSTHHVDPPSNESYILWILDTLRFLIGSQEIRDLRETDDLSQYFIWI